MIHNNIFYKFYLLGMFKNYVIETRTHFLIVLVLDPFLHSKIRFLRATHKLVASQLSKLGRIIAGLSTQKISRKH